MRLRLCFWIVMLSASLGCGSGEDESTERPDASTNDDANSAVDAAPECTPPLKAMLLYPAEGCDAQPQWVCISVEAGSRNTRYCLCEPGGLSDDLGWTEGAMKPWAGRGMWVYPEAGCDDSVSRVCSEATYEYGTWCGCSGESYESMAPTAPYSKEGACGN